MDEPLSPSARPKIEGEEAASAGWRSGPEPREATAATVVGEQGAVGESTSWKNWLFAAAFGAADFLAYQPAWHAGFVWDDDLHLLNNPVLRSGGLARAWASGGYINYWPLTFTVYRLEFATWGLNPLGFHLANIALHILAASLVWRMLVELGVPGAGCRGGAVRPAPRQRRKRGVGRATQGHPGAAVRPGLDALLSAIRPAGRALAAMRRSSWRLAYRRWPRAWRSRCPSSCWLATGGGAARLAGAICCACSPTC